MKFVVALNKKSPLPAQVNAVGHLCIGMPGLLEGQSAMLRSFLDKDGVPGSLLTDYPLIIFAARNSNHLRDAHAAAIAAGIPANGFFECHRDHDPIKQEKVIRSIPLAEQNYVGLSLFGPDNELREITRRFSLMREAKVDA